MRIAEQLDGSGQGLRILRDFLITIRNFLNVVVSKAWRYVVVTKYIKN